MTEQAFSGYRTFIGHRDLREQIVDQCLLSDPQLLALGAAVKAVQRGRISGFVRSHAGGA